MPAPGRRADAPDPTRDPTRRDALGTHDERAHLAVATWTRFAAAVAAGLLLSCARPPVDLGLLGLVALAPLWWAWRDVSPGRAALLGLVAGAAYYGVLVSWVWYFGAVAIVPLVLVLAASWAAAGAVLAWLAGRGVRSPFVLAAVWVLFETLIGRWPVGGLSWGEVGYTLHGVGFGRALASWGGVLFVSYVAVACSALLVDLGVAAWTRRRAAVRGVAIGAVALVAVVVVADVARFTPKPTGTLRYALLQGNDHDRELTQQEVDTEYLTRSHLALAATLQGRYDLIVFPESSIDNDPEVDPPTRAALVGVARAHGADVLANAITTDARGRSFNTNLLYEPDGTLQGRYSKQHLVPFGEYIPFQSVFGHIGATRQIETLFTHGHGDTIFHVAGKPIGSIICFESAFGPLVRGFVRDGAQAIVVTTNNRSYRRSSNSAQHIEASQMRAAETARPVLHASISGITAVFDASGHELRHTRLFHDAAVTGTATTTTGETPYVRYGDWVVWGSGLVVAAAVAIAIRRRRLAAPRHTAGPEPAIHPTERT